jgi:thioredoxin-related protein
MFLYSNLEQELVDKLNAYYALNCKDEQNNVLFEARSFPETDEEMKALAEDAYEKPNIINAINEDFIPVKFNPEIKGVMYNFEGRVYSGDQLAGVISNNQISGYPTTIFIYPKTKNSELVPGYKNAEQMAPILTEVKKKFYGKN